MSGVNKACCSIPPIVAQGYQGKGEYKTINGLKTYVTGPESATKAILVIYDIFGFFPQTIQGADILATASEQKYRVFIPDFFQGEPTKAAPPANLPKIPSIVSEANKLAAGGSFQSWSILGYCWGGKITTLASGQDNKLFTAAVQCHPAMLDPNDAKSVNIPMAVLASKDENPKDVEAFGANLKQANYVETFSTQIHGWMAARSNLEDEQVRKEYERGYRTALDFLQKHA
nr:dienelactone hydrolase family protein [Aspergillus niger CBS 513.88]|eukprot:XP_001395965.2 dienelactone hydrolase family protein [Aspergillus niger CBS 513.88]